MRRLGLVGGRIVGALAGACVAVGALGATQESSEDGGPPPLPPAAVGDIFSVVKDRAPITFRETAAYAELLRRAREQSVEELAREARRDVLFPDLVNRPERYRGVPIRLQGTARRIHPLHDLPEELAPRGRLYEAWTFTDDGQGNPVVLVFEDVPEGLPLGNNVHALVVFHGYFFKLLAYQAGDTARFAPMLIGRISYTPEEAGRGAVITGERSPLWVILPVALLGTYALLRLVMILQRGFAGRDHPRRFGAPPTQEISPEDLDAWVRASGERPPENDSNGQARAAPPP